MTTNETLACRIIFKSLLFMDYNPFKRGKTTNLLINKITEKNILVNKPKRAGKLMGHRTNHRRLSPLDHFICGVDRALRSISHDTQIAGRNKPEPEYEFDTQLDEQEIKHAAGLMRVNHAGEVCAQALYQGQAATAKLEIVREDMENAADEEMDHLAWCEDRLKELNSQPSLLNPLWYALSFGIGAGAGLIGDKISLGFVAATEEQVCKHLKSHMEKLPEADAASKAIVKQMIIDEERHAKAATAAGGVVFPLPIKLAMSGVSKVMTGLSYRI